jgi:hypothetical protein
MCCPCFLLLPRRGACECTRRSLCVDKRQSAHATCVAGQRRHAHPSTCIVVVDQLQRPRVRQVFAVELVKHPIQRPVVCDLRARSATRACREQGGQRVRAAARRGAATPGTHRHTQLCPSPRAPAAATRNAHSHTAATDLEAPQQHALCHVIHAHILAAAAGKEERAVRREGQAGEGGAAGQVARRTPVGARRVRAQRGGAMQVRAVLARACVGCVAWPCAERARSKQQHARHAPGAPVAGEPAALDVAPPLNHTLQNAIGRRPQVDLAVQGCGGQLAAVRPPGQRQHVVRVLQHLQLRLGVVHVPRAHGAVGGGRCGVCVCACVCVCVA